MDKRSCEKNVLKSVPETKTIISMQIKLLFLCPKTLKQLGLEETNIYFYRLFQMFANITKP